jgi:phosphoglycerate dehydrogenase-like enzyme
MKIIILATTIEQGNKLKDSIKFLNSDFSSIDNYTKNDILSNPSQFEDTFYIFSSWYMPNFLESEIKDYLPSLKAVFYAAGTVKYFATPFLNKGVRIFSSATANAIPVAEFVTAQILLANKGYFQAQKEYRKPLWKFSFNKARNYSYQKKGNYKAKIGVIGCGAIGAGVVKLLKSYQLEVLVYDPYLSEERIKELDVKRIDLVDLFSTCDVISNHLPNIDETVGIINFKLLSLMKKNATFINTGRGQQVVEKDLVKIMRKKPNACSLLDVTIKEPIRPWSKLLRLKNVFITPHIAGSLSNENNRMIEYMLSAYFNFIAGNTDICEVQIDDVKKQT